MDELNAMYAVGRTHGACMHAVGRTHGDSIMHAVGRTHFEKQKTARRRSTDRGDRPTADDETTRWMDGVECRECVFIFVSKLPRRGGDDTPRLDAREVGKLNTRADIHASRESYAHRRARGT
jgi:hypothetical protein